MNRTLKEGQSGRRLPEESTLSITSESVLLLMGDFVFCFDIIQRSRYVKFVNLIHVKRQTFDSTDYLVLRDTPCTEW